MKVRTIAIEREYGSGGTRIAELAAEHCGIACYGRQVLEEAARRRSVSVSELEQYEETASGSLIYSMFVMSQSRTGNPDLLSQEGKLYVEENRVIREFAASGPAIFVGHCAAHALHGQEGIVKVFIRADEESREKRAVQDYGIPPQEAAVTCRRFNKKRANYYGFCTRRPWDDLRGYDLVLDSSRLGIEGCAAVLETLLKQNG